MDYLAKPFGPMPALLARAEHITKVHAICVRCGQPAQHSHRLPSVKGAGADEQVLIGETDKYEPLCRHCFNAALKEEGTPYNLVFLASAEEEVSGKGGIESVLPLLPKIDVALVGEPTGMQPAIAEKGLMVLDVTAHGKAGHAARDEGDNAIYHAIEDIEWFRNYKWEKVSPLLGPVKMTVTIVNAGTQHNVVPDSCTFTVDVRSNECYTNRELFDEIGKNVKSEVKARSFRLGSSGIDVNHPLVQKVISMGGKPFGSPTLSDQALMPFPSFKMGPGESKRSHSADEFVDFCEIEQAIETYLELLK